MRLAGSAISILTIVLFCLSAAGAADIENGFMGRRWGTDISDHEGLTKLYAKKAVAYYINPNEVHTIIGIKVPNVVYGFHYGKLFAVYIGLDSIEAYSEILKYMKSEYGLPDKSNYMKNQLAVWKWKYKDVKIKLKTYEKTGKMKLAFYYMPLSNKLNEAQVAELEKFHEKSLHFFPTEKGETPEMIPLLRF